MTRLHFILLTALALMAILMVNGPAFAAAPAAGAAEESVDKLPWWPTDAQPGPVKDEATGGYWWWPDRPGTVKDLWGNRGYAYVNKLIYDWREGVGKNVQVTITDVAIMETELKPSLLVKRTIRDLKLRFKDSSTEITADHNAALNKTLDSLKRNPKARVLIAGDSGPDVPAEISQQRAAAVEKFLIDKGIAKDRISVVGAGKLEEAHLVSKKKKDPGALEMIVAEVEEVMIPGPKK